MAKYQQEDLFSFNYTENEASIPKPQTYKDAAASAATVKSDIQDFGEKIGGAKKDLYVRNFGALLEKEPNIDEPFSKMWPEPNYENLLQQGYDTWIVAAIRCLREVLMPKPRNSSYKIRRWSQRFTRARDMVRKLLEEEISKEEAQINNDWMRLVSEYDSQAEAFQNRIMLYERFGHQFSQKDVSITLASYARYHGVDQNPPLMLYEVCDFAKQNWRTSFSRLCGKGATKEEALADYAQYLKQIANEKAQRLATKGEKTAPKINPALYRILSPGGRQKDMYIARKAGKNWVQLSGTFDSLQDIYAYKEAHLEEMEHKFQAMKNLPSERRKSNKERIGEEYRQHKDVTPELFMETFGFRGVEFGNWVEQEKRQADLNHTYDALLDLAHVLHVLPRALSLNGELGIAFGARGAGGAHPAKAHYEPAYVVINLTKKNGAGSLAHEWFHALDNYFSRQRGNNAGMMLKSIDVNYIGNTKSFDDEAFEHHYNQLNHTSLSVRKDVVLAFGEVLKAIRDSGLKERCEKLDQVRTKDYWSTTIEMGARSFESYVVDKLTTEKISDDFLANFVTENEWKMLEDGKITSYPYPTEAEKPTIHKAFENLFSTIKVRQEGKQYQLYSTSNGNDLQRMATEAVLIPAESLTRKEQTLVNFAQQELGLQMEMLQGAKELHGKFDPEEGKLYLNRDSETSLSWTFWHEAFHAMKQKKPELYEQMVAAIEKASPIREEQIEAYKKEIQCPHMSRELVVEEMLADRFAKEQQRSKILGALKKENRSIAQQVVSWFSDLADRFKDFCHTPKSGIEDKQVQVFQKEMKKMAMFQPSVHGR